MKPVRQLQMGKAGLSSAFVEQVRSVFESEGMVKISILRSACRDKSEAMKIGETLVEALGTKFGFKLVGYVLTVIKFRKDQR
ncbi:YhbY family RNA-binding protein [Candidatus Pacearchaeota archaeon]|nr:YhbY family RNA-binding protein [Candidatus Pacearchaeota archaeon]